MQAKAHEVRDATLRGVRTERSEQSTSWPNSFDVVISHCPTLELCYGIVCGGAQDPGALYSCIVTQCGMICEMHPLACRRPDLNPYMRPYSHELGGLESTAYRP